jgi:diguanylate cyclase (GGDEF)-like protein
MDPTSGNEVAFTGSERERLLLTAALEAILVMKRGCIVACNERALDVLGQEAQAAVVGRPLSAFVAPVGAPSLFESDAAPGNTAPDRIEVNVEDAGGGRERMELVHRPFCHEERPLRSVALRPPSQEPMQESSEEARFMRAAYRDALTALPNRRLFLFRVWEAITMATLGGKSASYAVLFLDPDRFKLVNDSLGHGAGDALLRKVAERFRQTLGEDDTLGRFGGDEFAVLLPAAGGTGETEQAATRLLAALEEPFALEGRAVNVSVSTGAVVGSDEHETPEQVLRDADTATYRAKHGGGGRMVTYTPAMGEAARSRFRLETDLHRALEREELRLHYQPLLSLRTGRLAGFEALLRWQHPERGLLAPKAFIEAAEETGLLARVDRWALQAACRRLAAWSAAREAGNEPPLMLSVNCSKQTLLEGKVPRHADDVIAETSFDTSREPKRMPRRKGGVRFFFTPNA